MTTWEKNWIQGILNIDLRKFWEVWAHFQYKIDSHQIIFIQCACDTAESVEVIEGVQEGHVIQSLTETDHSVRLLGRGDSSGPSTKPYTSCKKDYSSSYLPWHITMCKGKTVPTSTPADLVGEGGRTSTPINSDAHVDEVWRNVFFPFYIGLDANMETEINLSQLKDEMFSLERSIMVFQQAGPSCQLVKKLNDLPR